MNSVNRNSVLNSIHEHLEPGASLIDGRGERDWLRFLSDFAVLVNFYDHDNVVQDHWAPFLLKDPVFLMAAISGTNFTKLHTLYLGICRKLEQLLQPSSDKKDLPSSFNQLFDQLMQIFIKIKQWAGYMQRSAMNYPLKKYVITQIKTTFSNQLQAILSLRQELFSASMIAGLAPLDPLVAAEFEGYEERIWKAGEFKLPYWELMGLLHPLKENTFTAIFKALTNAADLLFNFLQVIITQASTEFGRLTELKSRFPDTTLLRTFIHLLRNHQDQLNGIASKHLSFYYQDILNQTRRLAVADRAYLVASLTTKDSTFNLPAGTTFDAGIDAQKNAVIFESTEDVVLNPAAIPTAYTLSRSPTSNDLSVLQLQTIANPGVMQKDAQGKVLSWDTLGARVPDPSTQQMLGISFASPMLLLREGIRKIKLSLRYSGDPDLNMLRQSKAYLSTLNDWFEVSTDIQLADPSSAHNILISIELKNTDPSIERFLVDPDGMEGSWPMFKLVFDQITGPEVPPPMLHSMQIDVTVTGVENLQLYNDYGALSTKVAFPPFGPSPLNGSDFILGSNEIFSKPLNSLTVELNWSVLPPDFAIYYQTYNLYLNNQLRILKTPEPSWWEKIFGKKETTEPVIKEENEPFNNTCFTINFEVLEEKTWTPVVFNTIAPAATQPAPGQAESTQETPAQPSAEPAIASSSADPLTTTTPNAAPVASTNLLFLEDNKQLSAFSTYSSTAMPLKACDPSLQNQPMKFTELSTAGFMKMELTGPEYGFGSGIYPNVVSAVTLYNSQVLYNKEDVAFADPAQMPFAPKLKGLSVDYSASVQYVFDQESTAIETLKDYPVQCFLYTPFGNYKIYDNLDQPPAQKYTIGGPDTNQKKAPSGIPLYACYEYEGYLYLAIDDLVPASKFNLYFEMATKTASRRAADAKVGYYYLSTEGWLPLAVLSDGTRNLTCSGIVSLNVPADITMESSLMPGQNYWMSIAANDISHVAATVLLSTNGVEVQRTDTTESDANTDPTIPADTITKTQKTFPLISTLLQPFPSFGGRAAENMEAMNQRISNRLKTKDRAVTVSDYIRLIRQEFNDIYDAVSIYDSTVKTTNVYVVKSVDVWTAPHAFLPMVSSSQEDQIQVHLRERTSAFSVISVMNPDFQSVTVCATITIQSGYEFLTIQQEVIHALNIYLSPWIKNDGTQVEIYQDITDVQVSGFIKTISGVVTVEAVSFKTWMYNPADADAEKAAIPQQTVAPLKKSALFISNMVHQISLNPSAI
jgi:hypothetical protein